MRRNVRGFALVALAATSLSVQAVQTDLIRGTFDTNDDGWFSPDLCSNFSPHDANGSATSGALGMRTYPESLGYAISPSVRVNPGAAYEFGGQAHVTGGTAALSIECYVMPAPDAQPVLLQQLVLAQGTPWSPVASVTGVLPSDAHVVNCYAKIQAPFSHIAFGEFDNLYFRSDDAVFANGFDGPAL